MSFTVQNISLISRLEPTKKLILIRLKTFGFSNLNQLQLGWEEMKNQEENSFMLIKQIIYGMEMWTSNGRVKKDKGWLANIANINSPVTVWLTRQVYWKSKKCQMETMQLFLMAFSMVFLIGFMKKKCCLPEVPPGGHQMVIMLYF